MYGLKMQFFKFFEQKHDFLIQKSGSFLQKRGQKMHDFESFLTCECKNDFPKCIYMDQNAKMWLQNT